MKKIYMLPVASYLICLLLILFSCKQNSSSDPYLDKYETWKLNRFGELHDPYGWPSVVGLYRLKNTIQHFGSSSLNDFILPQTAPSSFGSIEMHGDSLVMKTFKNMGVIVNGKKMAMTRMFSDIDTKGPTIGEWKSLQWYIIKRQDQYFLRVKDTLSTYRSHLDSLSYFSPDTTFQVKAKFVKVDTTEKVTYSNVLGMKFKESFAGYLDFDLRGNTYRLKALGGTDSTYFVIFADQTTGVSTYGGGRFLYPLKANANGETILDFNKAINPPCVFTPYATCPLPPPENFINESIEAGEKYNKFYE